MSRYCEADGPLRFARFLTVCMTESLAHGDPNRGLSKLLQGQIRWDLLMFRLQIAGGVGV